MEDPQIQCPQPVRPLKRTASHFDPIDLTPFKRRSFQREPPVILQGWVFDLPAPFNRCGSKSDSCLLGRKVDRHIGTPAGKTSDRPASTQPAEQLGTSPLSNPPHMAHMAPPGTPDPSQSTWMDTPGTSSRTDSKNSNRVKDPKYRTEIESHGVDIDNLGEKIPEELNAIAQGIVGKGRRSPGLNVDQLASIKKVLGRVVNADEGTVRDAMISTPLFPGVADYDETLAMGANVLFDKTALPLNTSRATIATPIVQPKPDKHYGYAEKAFTEEQRAVMKHNRLRVYAMPNTANCWPFFAVEFKSGSRGGTEWVAENQNAGTGTHCVNSVETLMNFTKTADKLELTKSMMFSCVAQATNAAIWVHWQQVGPDGRFVSSPIEQYHFHKPLDMNKFRGAIRNIIDDGLKQRHPNIAKALNELIPELSKWDKEDAEKEKLAREAKKRRASLLSDSTSTKKGNSANVQK
ncbi:hypothetical protein MMC30_007902 [Trapelia coarctata]|nr:hypothetical protein [Trapelia coarctata]